MSISPVSSEDSGRARPKSLETEASERALDAKRMIDQVKIEGEQTVNHIRDQYEKQYVSERDREDASLEAQRTKGYQRVRDFQRAQQSELSKIRREGETQIHSVNEYYRKLLFDLEHNSKEAHHKLQEEEEQRLAYDKLNGAIQETELKSQRERTIKQLTELAEDQTQKLRKETHDNFEQQKARSDEANLQTIQKYDDRFKMVEKEQQEILSRVQTETSERIRELKENYAQKLADYEIKQRDPFYSMIDLNAQISDDGDSFVLQVTIPEDEHDHVTANVTGDNLVIGGYRRSEQTLELGPGHRQGTASFQTFHESFPLPWPVDAKKLSRESHGDQVFVRVPKKSTLTYKPFQADKPAKARAEPPQFPKTINEAYNRKQQGKAVGPAPKHKDGPLSTS